MAGPAPIFWRLWRGAGNSLRRFSIAQPLRGLSVLVVIATVWALIFALTYGVLEFLDRQHYRDLKAPLLRSLLNLFFFALFFMVLFSDALVVWSGIFRTTGARYQAQLPLTNRALYWGAAVEGGMWAGWAVLVLTVPLVAGLAVDSAEPWLFVPGGMIALLAFLFCCVAAGALGAVLLARVMPLLRRGLRGILLVGSVLLAMLALVLLGNLEQSSEPATFLSDVIGRIRFIENPYLPPMWIERALSSAMRSDWSVWSRHLLLLVATAAALAIAGEHLAHRRLRRDLDRVIGRGDEARRDRSKPWRLLPLLPRDLALLVGKDLRLFRRDPAQILQFALFFGLLGFYILLLPRIGQAFLEQGYDWWRKAVSLLNLTAVSMALATFTGRFVYPLLSLEGRRLWVLILAPWERHRVVTAKFVFALLVGLPVSVLLVVLSGAMLELGGAIIAYQALVTVCLGLGLSAGALGLGARLADYREDNPAKLVSGYGGTVNLLLSLVYSGMLLLGAAIPLVAQGESWGWVFGVTWTLGSAVLWTAIGLPLAWRWFGRGI